MTGIGALASDLRTEARRTNERRLLVLHGPREACYEGARAALAASEISERETVLVGERDALPVARVAQRRTGTLLGTTTGAIVFDAHDTCRPNALGRAVSTVDGGGLVLFLCPSLDDWPDKHDEFDASLAVPPYDPEDVSGAFRRRLVGLLRVHRGIAIVNVRTHRVERDGLIRPAPRPSSPNGAVSRSDSPHPGHGDTGEAETRADGRFPRAVYDACVTADQIRCVRAFEHLRDRRRTAGSSRGAVVVEADRGRGKSSAAGLVAGALAARGDDVLVTAPEYRAAAEVFARAEAVLDDLGVQVARCGGTDDGASPRVLVVDNGGDESESDADSGDGRIRFVPPVAAVDVVDRRAESATGERTQMNDRTVGHSPGRKAGGREAGGNSGTDGTPDVVFVDEAAGVPVPMLDRLLAADRIGFATTVHGYEGAGRGFSVRFRERLTASDHEVREVRLDDPIRYATGDPVEVWLFRALLLDARPSVDSLVTEATPETTRYEHLSTAELLADEHLLRETFGLLVAAHYRTEPNDLARLLCAPNLAVRALTYRNHVVSVCLLAREGGLSAERRADLYQDGRIKGHMIPDLLTSQLRDERAGEPRGFRVVRIATHEAVRSRGLGSLLLDRVRGELDRARSPGATDGGECDSQNQNGTEGGDHESADREHLKPADWLGVGYGATPPLIDFWRQNGFRTVHVSTTRNETSGEHSLLMLAGLTDRGRDLATRHARWFTGRFPAVLSDALSGLDPDIARGALRGAGTSVDPDLSARDWRVICGAAYGSGLYDADPRPFRCLALAYLADPDLAGPVDADRSCPDRVLSAREERLLVRRVFQARSPERVAARLGYESERQCLRALGDAYAALVDRYGDEMAETERERYDR